MHGLSHQAHAVIHWYRKQATNLKRARDIGPIWTAAPCRYSCIVARHTAKKLAYRQGNSLAKMPTAETQKLRRAESSGRRVHSRRGEEGTLACLYADAVY
jgi:hypothetical protein